MSQVIAFDIDGTLVGENDQPRYQVIDLLRTLHALGSTIWVWSGGGKDYAERWVERLGLSEYVEWVGAKDPRLPVDIAVDDALDADIGHIATLYV